MDFYYVYILHSQKLNRFYIGTTDNPANRLIEHNSIKYEDAYTVKGIPWDLKLAYQCKSSENAYLIEKFIKRMKSKVFIQKIIDFPDILVDIENNL
ncbi:MAG: GIY-YIG nuclease family protein [Fluviicola sp.]|nr:GIY-YIG nuclease family protein [Fluviicola sp.]MBP6271396.1 GIY-YIG nuclease family protein [Fluviicola sp.]MBP6271397.1 GIY-YIG nuclease family protein [Fluviicola sp.]